MHNQNAFTSSIPVLDAIIEERERERERERVIDLTSFIVFKAHVSAAVLLLSFLYCNYNVVFCSNLCFVKCTICLSLENILQSIPHIPYHFIQVI